MKVTAEIKEINSDACKHTIVRNLSRILDIRVLDVDIESKTISFVYDSNLAFEKVRRELWRIGYPIFKSPFQESSRNSRAYRADFSEHLLTH